MSQKRRLAAAAILCALVLGACGDDGGKAAAPLTDAVPTAATPASSSASFAAGSPEAAAANAYRTAFDSALAYDAKSAYIEDADALKETIAQYTAAAARMGGFKLEPTAVVVTGTTAAITYDVYFGTNPQYRDQVGAVTNLNGTWRVSRAEFCSFMQSARTPCPA